MERADRPWPFQQWKSFDYFAQVAWLSTSLQTVHELIHGQLGHGIPAVVKLVIAPSGRFEAE